jgi:hypothetical protein
MTRRYSLIAMGALWLLSCGGEKKDGLSDELESLISAGLSPVAFGPVTSPIPAGAIACQAGSFDKLSALMCSFPSADAAMAGQPDAETWLGTALTGTVVRRDLVLLAIADREQANPSGKQISKIAQVFRRLPPAEMPTNAAEAPTK